MFGTPTIFMTAALVKAKVELKKADAKTLKEAQKLADKISKIVLIAGVVLVCIVAVGRIV